MRLGTYSRRNLEDCHLFLEIIRREQPRLGEMRSNSPVTTRHVNAGGIIDDVGKALSSGIVLHRPDLFSNDHKAVTTQEKSVM